MEEADIYINTNNEEEFGPNLALTQLIFKVDEFHGVYSFINSTYETILHELGHALGLKHVSIAGNATNYGYSVRTIDQWEAPMSLFVLNQLAIKGATVLDDPTQIPFVFRHDTVFPFMVVADEAMLASMEYFTKAAKLGEQDKMALMCVYKF